jgi:hypothetical protein
MKLHSQMDPNEYRKQQYMYDEKGELVLDEEGRPALARAPTRLTPEQERFKVLGIDPPPKDPDDDDEDGEQSPEDEEREREEQNALSLAASHDDLRSRNETPEQYIDRTAAEGDQTPATTAQMQQPVNQEPEPDDPDAA